MGAILLDKQLYMISCADLRPDSLIDLQTALTIRDKNRSNDETTSGHMKLLGASSPINHLPPKGCLGPRHFFPWHENSRMLNKNLI
jgi:hypothetical protein